MILQERIELMVRLGEFLKENPPEWQEVKARASRENAWFVPEFIEHSVNAISRQFLERNLLQPWAASYSLPEKQHQPKTVGLVMAGNLPLVGFHDFLCVFISGHSMRIKASSKDEVLIQYLVQQLGKWETTLPNQIAFADRLNGCDAYIATGSNNSSRYFDYYFGKYPNIIRRNRTSVALLDGTESSTELEALADDIQLYFGLGCRNITQLYVPEEYDFIPLLTALKKYGHFMDFHKYKHNFDYHLALLIMANKFYMTNDSVILAENSSPFSPVSQVHYAFYKDKQTVLKLLQGNTDIQCVAGHAAIPFGLTQSPRLTDYADGVDTLKFLQKL